MDVFRIMAVLIEMPWLALVHAALFFLLFLRVRARFILVTALLWLAYVPYEYAMKYRLLCTGECNIRVDLLLIYALLLTASLVSIVLFAMRWRRKA